MYELAQHRDDFSKHQKAWVYEWLDDNGINVLKDLYGVTDAVERKVFDREFAQMYPDVPRTSFGTTAKRPTSGALKSWYQKYVREFPIDKIPPSRDHDVLAAQAHFGCRGLRDVVRTLRREIAPPEWKSPGNKGRKEAARQSG